MVVIAISGQPGAGSTTTSNILASRLNLRYFSPGRLFKDIAKGTVTDQYYYNLFKEKCDKLKISIPSRALSDDSHATLELWNSSFGKSKSFHKIIDDLQKELAAKGNIVIDGKLSLNMIPRANVKIWLKASLPARALRAAGRDSLIPNEAQQVLASREQAEREEWKKMYGFDYWEQEKQADLVIDTSGKSPEEVVSLILEKLSNNKL